MHNLGKTYNIGIVAYPGVQMSSVLGLEDLFAIASSYSEQSVETSIQTYQVHVDTVPTISGLKFDAIIMPPNLTGARGETETDLQNWIAIQHATGATICSVCGGVFLLGYSGLLKGRPVTTHWLLAEELEARFPETNVQAEHLLIDDHDIVTAGGLMAWLDLGLFLVRQTLGPRIMMETARHLLVDPSGREQRNYRSFRPILTHGDDPILRIQHWLESNIGEQIGIKHLATQAGLSERTFLRRFKIATSQTPNAYVQQLRVEKARGLLERTKKSVSEIGWMVGYQDISAFSRVFKATTGLSAGEYRKRFGGFNEKIPNSIAPPYEN